MRHLQPNFKKTKTKHKHGFVLLYDDQIENITPNIYIIIYYYLFIHLPLIMHY